MEKFWKDIAFEWMGLVSDMLDGSTTPTMAELDFDALTKAMEEHTPEYTEPSKFVEFVEVC